MSRLVAIVLPAIALCASAGAVRAETATTPLVNIAITAPTHRPPAGEQWQYSVSVTNRAGNPLAGTIVPVVVENGQRIDTVGWFGFKRGRFQGTYRWRLVHTGRVLTFRVRVHVTKRWRYKDFWIRVQP